MRRAERIARTELHQARPAAVHASATMTADAGVPMVKVWSAAHDERTRVAHAEADGQTRPVDEPFEVGGELLRYPGDQANGSAKNTIQCRCT
ncbi:phage minor head protein, partial [Enterococcus faecium]|uniref:phage minor head protein n=1 Tax=Enterococcus faecium TaxID=1352 RepID=UPI003F898F9A